MMINTNELMRGNKVIVGKGTDLEEIAIIDEIFDFVVSLQGREFTTLSVELEPIPITEDLLLKNGFIKGEPISNYYDYEKECCGYWLTFKHNVSNMPKRDWFLHIDSADRCSVGGCDVQYVHQAQNLCNILGFKMEFII